MNVSNKTALICTLAGLFFTIGCDNPANPQPANPAVGTWKGIVSDSTMTMVVKSDSTFETFLPNVNGAYDVTGRYSLKGTAITLSYASGLQGQEGIPPPNTPVNGTISGTKMRIPVPYDQNVDSVTLNKQ